MVYNRIFDSIEESSITPIIPEQGDLFDPNYHEAIEVEESDVFNKDEIIEVQTYGYKYENILIMPAKVKISKSKGKN